MIQKRIAGIDLWVYLSVLDDKGQLPSEQYCKEIFTQVLAQQDGIGFNHGDVRIENIMVNPNTGKFLSLIDWDFATLRIPENDSKYAYNETVGICKRDCHF